MTILDRRDFLKDTLTKVGLGVILPVGVLSVNSCENYWDNPIVSQGIDIDVSIADNPILEEKGGGVIISFDNLNYGIPVILINIGDDNFACYSSLCTHQSCFADNDDPSKSSVWLQPRRGVIICNCHESKFDAFNGGVPIEGPAEKPLKQYPCEFNIETQIITIKF